MKKRLSTTGVMPYVFGALLVVPFFWALITPTKVVAEEKEPFGEDFWADFFKSLDEVAAQEAQKQEPAKQEAPKNGEEVSKPTEEIKVTKSTEKISSDPEELFKNPPTETLSLKDKKIVIPVKQAKIAAVDIIKNFLNSIAIIEAKLTDEYLHERFYKYAIPTGEIKVILNFIIDKDEYLSIFLVPPAEAKDVATSFQKIRKQIIDLKHRVETFNKSLAIVEEKVEAEKEKELAEFAAQKEKEETPVKKAKRFDIKKKVRGRTEPKEQENKPARGECPASFDKLRMSGARPGVSNHAGEKTPPMTNQED